MWGPRHVRTENRITSFYNVPTTDQVTEQGVAAEFLQKSHVAALDLSYDHQGAFINMIGAM